MNRAERTRTMRNGKDYEHENEITQRRATEAVGEHLKFIGVLPLWAQGHENEVRRAFDHYAQLGASEAINWLARNGRIV